MTRAIDGLVNVDFADWDMPEWMVRVKDDYFKAGDAFFKSPTFMSSSTAWMQMASNARSS